MASLSLARPGKFSARRYIGDLAGLFERQRRRVGVALTPESFAADLAANDTLRSSLFTLCNAISHMGESDLSPEEMLDLIARALGGAGSAEGETGTLIPDDMREAFLSGYTAWQNRGLQPSEPDDAWPPADPAARKPPMHEPAPDVIAHSEAATAGEGNAGPIVPVPASGRRTLQEAISMARRDHATATRPALLPGGVIPFPDRRGNAADDAHVDPSSSGFHQDGFARRRPVPGPNLRAEDAFLTQPANADDRPPGIDALLAAAPAWAKATPTARSFDEEAFLSRHAYLSPARRPGTLAPASLYYAETPAQPLAPPPAMLPTEPAMASIQTAVTFTAHAAVVPPRIGLDAEDDPLLSPMEQLQAYMLRLSPRKVFLVLASLTILAGGLAGLMAYRTLHPRLPQFKDLEPSAQFGAVPPAAPTPAVPMDLSNPPASPIAAPVQAAAVVATPSADVAPPKPIGSQSPVAILPSPKPRASAVHQTPVAVWPPVPQQIARDTTPALPATPPASTSPAPAAQPAPSGPLYVPAPTIISYALATPQPAYPAQANGASGTVSVEITVSRLGDVISARATSGPTELRAAAAAAARAWRFRPYLVSGTPVVVSTTLQFFFSGP